MFVNRSLPIRQPTNLCTLADSYIKTIQTPVCFVPSKPNSVSGLSRRLRQILWPDAQTGCLPPKVESFQIANLGKLGHCVLIVSCLLSWLENPNFDSPFKLFKASQAVVQRRSRGVLACHILPSCVVFKHFEIPQEFLICCFCKRTYVYWLLLSFSLCHYGLLWDFMMFFVDLGTESCEKNRW